VKQFKYSGTALTDQNSIHEEIKSRLTSGNAALREGHGLGVFENRVLGEVFGSVEGRRNRGVEKNT